ncbi:MAG: TolC family protein [Pseudomonadota bacterium]
MRSVLLSTWLQLGFQAAAVLVAIPSVNAAESMCLSFEDALAIAADRDPNVSTSRAERDIAAADLKEARSLFKPQVSAFGRTGVGDVGLVDGVIQNQVGVRASQRLLDFGDAKYARLEARRNIDASTNDIRASRIEAKLDAGFAYINILDADARLAATKERSAYFENQLNAVEAALAGGGATRSERADVAAQFADAQAFELELRFLKEQAQTRLLLDIGAPPTVCSPESVEMSAETLFASVGSIEDAVADALANSPNIRALENRTDAFEAARKRESRARLPVISVVGLAAYSSTGSNGNFELQDRVGIDVSVPLYTGAALSARSGRAAARRALANGEANAARRRLEEDVSILYRRILSMKAQLIRRTRVEDEARKQFEAAQIEFDNDARTLPDLVEIRLEYENASLRRIALRFDLLRQQLELLALTARLVED